MVSAGTVYLVGAGPGDEGLITVKGLKLIESCDVLIFDQLVNDALTGRVKPGCEVVRMGKGPELKDSVSQDEIETLMVERAKSGLQVVRLKGGDPFIFGRGGEEMERLHAEGIPYEVVPGVTAALAAAGYAGIPLTHRDHSSVLTFLTGHEDPTKAFSQVQLEELARMGGTLCIYMGMRTLESLVSRLLAAGLDPDTPAAVIQWATLGRQTVVRSGLSDLVSSVESAGVGSPAIIIIGKVAGSPNSLDWFGRKPLAGQRVAITRSRNQAGELKQRLESVGAEVLELPLIEVRPKMDSTTVTEVFAGLSSYEWIVFTSPNGVNYFFEIFFKAFKDIRSFGGMRVAAIGASTAREVQKQNIEVDLLPEESVSESLAEALIETGSLPSANVLVITGNQNRDVLARTLEQKGEAIVDTLQVYETIPTDLEQLPEAKDFREHGVDFITFTSSSTVHHFYKRKAELIPDGGIMPTTCSMGPITSKTLRSYNLPVDAEAKNQSLDGLLEAIIDVVKADQ